MKEKQFDPVLLKMVDELCIADDPAFTIVFDRNNECTQFMIQTILGRNDLIIESVRAEAALKNPYGHSVRLDILAMDSAGSLIDIEMQRSFHGWGNLSKRMITHSSMLGSLSLKKGKDYRYADELIVIFILDEDIMKRNEPRYFFRMMDTKEHQELKECNLTFVLANGSYRDTIESVESRFYSDLYEKRISNIKCPEMREGLSKVKGNKAMIERTYGILEKYQSKWMQEGMQQGVHTGKKDVAMNMLKNRKYSYSEIASLTKLSISEISEIASDMNKGSHR